MKKILTLFIVMITVVLLTGCSGENNKDLNKNINASLGDLTFELPGEFEKTEENSTNDRIVYDYQSDDNKNLCTLSISKSDYVSSDLNETIKTGYYGNEFDNISTKNINNNDWTFGSAVEDEKFSFHLYAINYNNKLYEVQYEDMGSGDLCAEYLDVIEENLHFEK